uniref:Uncharacterized protein n=1 Tax=Anguilla anguilla TaxID=7936 RepID=A0A0E9QYI6_ANGAN
MHSCFPFSLRDAEGDSGAFWFLYFTVVNGLRSVTYGIILVPIRLFQTCPPCSRDSGSSFTSIGAFLMPIAHFLH